MPYGCLSGIGVGGSLFILQFPLLPPQPLAPLQLPFEPPEPPETSVGGKDLILLRLG